jgi:S-formylglutathione hydrolase
MVTFTVCRFWNSKMEIQSTHVCFGGQLSYVSHDSAETGCEMRFSIFLPPQAATEKRPVLWWLSGLTCTEDNFTSKAGAYRVAAELGLIIVAPDTSPRGADVPDDEAYDLGQGAGFYLNATEAPWAKNFRMYQYITVELPTLVAAGFPVKTDAQGIAGHSMGGHGALTIGLKNPQIYRSVSALSPIVNPLQCPWGQKAFAAYLGDDQSGWAEYDSCELMRAAGDRSNYPAILIDQGDADVFLEDQLKPEHFVAACEAVGQPLKLRMQPGYDHGFFFVSTFIEDHLRHHAAVLC